MKLAALVVSALSRAWRLRRLRVEPRGRELLGSLASWLHGYAARMVTDTAPFRNPQYHRRGDVAERLSYGHMVELVTGLEAVIRTLVEAARYSLEDGGSISLMQRSKSSPLDALERHSSAVIRCDASAAS